MKKRNIILTIILSLISICGVIFGYSHLNNDKNQEIEIQTNKNDIQCLYGCPSSIKKKIKRKYIKIC